MRSKHDLTAGAPAASNRWRWLLLGSAVALLLPTVFGAAATVLATLSVVLAAQAALTGLQFLTLLRPKAASGAYRRQVPLPRFFSVHLATHNEPPEIVIATLRALKAQRTRIPFEVIVLDNNTRDPALWRPVAAYCARHPALFRFHHRMNVQGAKAGALNIALGLTAAQATHIVTVDADYRVAPDFLDRATCALRRCKADFLQFPQAYLMENAACGAKLELADYFRRAARFGSALGAPLLTGTLSVVSVDSLRAIGGWRHETLTEDAELGLRLCAAGYRGVMLDETVGRGLLPLSAASLQSQRWRWAMGNMQCLLRHAAVPGLSLRQRIAVVAQLTAWLNLALPAFAGLAAGVLATLNGVAFGNVVVTLSALTLLLAAAGAVGPLVAEAARRGETPTAIAEAVLVRLALLPTSAGATLAPLLGLRGEFRVTAKDGRPTRALRPSRAATVLGATALLCGIAVAADRPDAAFVALCLILSTLAVAHTNRRLAAYCQHLKELPK